AEFGDGGSGAHGGVGRAAGGFGGAESAGAAAGDHGWQRGAGRSAGARVAGGRATTLHGAQTAEHGVESAKARARGAARGVPPHRLRRGPRGGGAGARPIPGQVAETVPGGGDLAGRGGGRAADVLLVPAEP